MPLIPEAGGTERVTSLVAKGLTQLGHNCMGIMVFNRENGSITYNGIVISDLYAFLTEHKVDVVINQIAYDIWLLSAFLQNGGDHWKKEGGRIISCLHFDPNNPSFIQLLKSEEKLTTSQKISFLIHIILYPYYKLKKERIEGHIYNFIYDHSDLFVILSDKHKIYLKQVMRRMNYNKIISINNPPTFDEIISPQSLCKKQNIILVCARMSEYHKRISIILKTWKRLQKKGLTSDWQLKLVGDGPDIEHYKHYANIHKLQNIEFCGKQDPLPYYRKASILLLTSSAEGWGLTLTEALQNGVVPIVMNSSTVYTEIINDGFNGYLTPNGSIAKFTFRVQQLMNNPAILHNLQKNALISASQFSKAKILRKWLAALENK